MMPLTTAAETLTLLSTLPTLWSTAVATSDLPASRDASTSWAWVSRSRCSRSASSWMASRVRSARSLLRARAELPDPEQRHGDDREHDHRDREHVEPAGLVEVRPQRDRHRPGPAPC